ncbi:hypothetical protein BN175_420004 [Clostridioides difficile T23]|uniref:Transmembrane protein n=1 Tax=Clostridioides difficile TaxID=1496 RepID=A0A069A3B6_CLODI|nr:hypothetical protein BN169_480012 [Clostridioides difficile E16]CCL20503.1 hypothetical protein BN171_590001 [Clostridioides difficile E25]CCL32602.1 hypothetical protein BN174_530004 [Clostridioides difficile E15]CCL36300.1 hypothetical protein BN175_420004 [Clostridioides difficile T23]CCL40105.1 hypothetical protein BN176_570003 [Clostridioides difficile E19]CCL41386.1 hypothetical protein BN177_270012 [Clostridioides difficile E24]CCL45138.1 hypothetical protein BN178_310012 [Clostridi
MISFISYFLLIKQITLLFKYIILAKKVQSKVQSITIVQSIAVVSKFFTIFFIYSLDNQKK